MQRTQLSPRPVFLGRMVCVLELGRCNKPNGGIKWGLQSEPHGSGCQPGGQSHPPTHPGWHPILTQFLRHHRPLVVSISASRVLRPRPRHLFRSVHPPPTPSAFSPRAHLSGLLDIPVALNSRPPPLHRFVIALLRAHILADALSVPHRRRLRLLREPPPSWTHTTWIPHTRRRRRFAPIHAVLLFRAPPSFPTLDIQPNITTTASSLLPAAPRHIASGLSHSTPPINSQETPILVPTRP